jgi:DDE superfamily endonuclease
MSITSFDKLLSYIVQDIKKNNNRIIRLGGSVEPAVRLFITLRWLSGASYLDIFEMTGVSIAKSYAIVYETLQAIINCKQLDIVFPQTASECERAASGFRSISFGDAIWNCVGAIDGYLLKIYTPHKKEVGNVRKFFSGHYQCHGINIQAVCDHNCRFIYMSTNSPGSTNDREAYKQTSVEKLLSNIPPQYVIIGDAAYQPTERVIPLYYGVSRKEEDCDNFNFFGSQLRIRIEMSFGLMQMKWAVLQKPLRIKMKNIKYVMMAIARLHNFCIDERLQNGIIDVDVEDETIDTNKNPRPSLSDTDPQAIDQKTMSRMLPGVSLMRDQMASRVKELKLQRPTKNKRKLNYISK